MTSKTFEDVFLSALDDIEATARANGKNLTVLCNEAGISRVTPDRWRKSVPKTIELITRLQKLAATPATGKAE